MPFDPMGPLDQEPDADERADDAHRWRDSIVKDAERISTRLSWIDAARDAVYADTGRLARSARRLKTNYPDVPNAHLTQPELAELAKVSRPTLDKYAGRADDVPIASDAPVVKAIGGRQIDVLRQTHAQAVSAGYADGAVAAERMAREWEEDGTDEAYQWAVAIIKDTTLVYTYAQEYAPSIDDYLDGMEASDQARDRLTPERRAVLETLYRAGFDVGFVSPVVKACVRIRDRGPRFPALPER